MTKRLYRSEKDVMIGGVCAGLAQYLNIDPSVVRIVFVSVVLLGGSGVLVYIILWAILPLESEIESDSEVVSVKKAK
ncbi:MAG: PspC domain-containing protein [Candidatus Dojkabacteria bacterium]